MRGKVAGYLIDRKKKKKLKKLPPRTRTGVTRYTWNGIHRRWYQRLVTYKPKRGYLRKYGGKTTKPKALKLLRKALIHATGEGAKDSKEIQVEGGEVKNDEVRPLASLYKFGQIITQVLRVDKW